MNSLSANKSSCFHCEFCNVDTYRILPEFEKCPNCGNLFNRQYRTTEYEDRYFEAEYKNQYGKSYLEDKLNIQKKMKARLEQVITDIGETKNLKLLEIGSAAGFFLEIATAAGFDSLGWEISNYMTEYANKNGNKTIQGDLLELLEREKSDSYDIICAFYVIEHFSNQKKIWNGLSRLLKNQGILLLALPSFFGPVYMFHKKDWVKNHPVDHFMDYSPYGIKKVCNMFKLKLLHTYPDSLHPERFFLGRVFVFKQIYTLIQKMFKFSDTIFVILQKKV